MDVDPRPGVLGVDHPAAADVDAHVADRAVEEHEVPGLKLAPAHVPPHHGVLLTGVVRQVDPGVGPVPSGEARAVEAARLAGAAVRVGNAFRGPGRLEDLPDPVLAGRAVSVGGTPLRSD